MINANRIVAALATHGPLSDSDLRRLTGVEPHQQVNQICRRLEARGEIRRVAGLDGCTLNVLAGSSPLGPESRRQVVDPAASVGGSARAEVESKPGSGVAADGALVVIPCSAAKARGGQPGLVGPSVLDLLPPGLAEGLRHARAALVPRAGVDESRLMPARRRYTGSLYAAAGDAQERLIARSQTVVILSGGYGLVLADEPIGWYERPFRRADWPAGLLEACLVAVARRVGAAKVLAFCARSTGYAGLARRVRWRAAGLNAALVSPDLDGRGGALRLVPEAAGAALAEAAAGRLTSPWTSPGGVLVTTEVFR